MVFAPNDSAPQIDETLSLRSKKNEDSHSLLHRVNQTGLTVTPTTNALSVDLVNATRVGKVTVNLTSGTGSSDQSSIL